MKTAVFILLMVLSFQLFASDVIKGTYRVNQDTECNDGTRVASTYDVILDEQGTYSSAGFYTYRNDTVLGPRTITYVAGQFSCTGTFVQNQRTLTFDSSVCSQSDLADFSNNVIVPNEIISNYTLEIVASMNNAFWQFPAGNRNLILYNDPAEIETLNFPGINFPRVCVRQGDGIRLRNNNTVPLPTIEPGTPPASL